MSAAARVLVTGGAGFIGSHLVDALIARGYRVRVLDKLVPQVHAEPVPRFLNPEAEFLNGELSDLDLLDRALEDVEGVFHQAAEVGVGQSMYEVARYVGANTMATAVLWQKLVERTKKSRIRKLVVASSMSIYGEGAYRCPQHGPVSPAVRPVEQLARHEWDLRCPACAERLIPLPTPETKPLYPTSVYALTKYDQEQLCLLLGRAYGIPVVALRYFNTYGTRQALSNPYTGVCAIFSSRLLNHQSPVIFEDGEQTRDFVHVSDIVQANLAAYEGSGADYRAVNVGTGIATSVRDVARLLAEGLGRRDSLQIVAKYREGDIRHCVADITLARELLDFEPKLALADGIPQLLEWVAAESAADRIQQATDELQERALIR